LAGAQRGGVGRAHHLRLGGAAGQYGKAKQEQ
jgi:hypothetical protein